MPANTKHFAVLNKILVKFVSPVVSDFVADTEFRAGYLPGVSKTD